MDAWLSSTAHANVGWAVLVLGLLLLISVVSYAAGRSDALPSQSFDAKIKLFTSEASAWSTAAARSRTEQDPLRAVVQAAYGVAYLNVARSLASDSDIERVANVRIEELDKVLSSEQQRALKATAALCPKLAQPGVTAMSTGWLPT
jgi:hypothetical protein